MPFVKNAALVALAAAGASAAPTEMIAKRGALTTSPKVQYNGCTYNINGLGSFTSSFDVNFASLSSLTAATNTNITLSNALIGAGTAPFDRKFNPSNIGVNTLGQLTLTVPGGQKTNPISSAEIQSFAKDILYGSVRTVAKVSSVPGTTNAFSFYSNDTQESDIAFLTSDNSVVHLTNEQVSYGAPATSFQVTAPADAATAFHEYRLDWVPGKTMFYIDSVLVYTITQNVPSTPGFFLWNNWSNGNAWAKGPPAQDNVLTIQSITGYFNRTSVKVDQNSAVCQAATSAYQASANSCVGLANYGSSYVDANKQNYTIKCAYDLLGQGDLNAYGSNSFGGCFAMCDAYKGTPPCNAFAYVGGNGAGICYLKNLNNVKVSPNANSGVDLAYMSVAGFPPQSSSSSASSSSASKTSSATTTASVAATSSVAPTSSSKATTTPSTTPAVTTPASKTPSTTAASTTKASTTK